MLIGITGIKGVGKDTVGQYLVDKHEFRRLAFADKMYEALSNLFDFPLDKVQSLKGNTESEIPYAEVILQFGSTEWSWTWREFIQRFGTEMGRETFGSDFWIDRWQDAWVDISFLEPDVKNVVVTDVRFNNEAHHIQFCGGFILEVTREGYESDGHISEEGIDKTLIDAQITNDGTFEELYKDIDQFMEDVVNDTYHR